MEVINMDVWCPGKPGEPCIRPFEPPFKYPATSSVPVDGNICGHSAIPREPVSLYPHLTTDLLHPYLRSA